MILALSIENTHLVMGCFSGETLLFTSRMATDRNKTGNEYAISFKNILELHNIDRTRIRGSIVSSVVPALIGEIKAALYLLFNQEPLVVGPGVKTGLNILMDNPATLGTDLVGNAVAAAAEYPVPLIVIDMNTATTLLALDGQKRFVGSVIAPGVVLSVTALAAACDQLPCISLEAPKEVVEKDTVDCMKSGAVFGAASMLDGMILRMERQLGSSCTVLATGPYAATIVPHCTREITVDEHLLLKGLKRIYDRNLRK